MLEACAPPGPGHRDHPAAGAPARRRRGDPVQRHRGAAEGGRRRPRHQARRRPGGRPADPHRADLDQLRPLEAGDVGYVAEAVRLLVAELGATPLIGFAGAPFTLASYLVEGGPSRNHEHTKALMYGDPDLWHALLAAAGRHHRRRSCGCRSRPARARCSCSTPGSARCRRPTTRATCCRTRPRCSPRSATSGVPRIHFGVGTGELLGLMGEAGADVVGVDFRVPLDEATRRVGPDRALQGNLDPAVVFAPWDVVAERTRAVLAAGRAAPRPRVQPRPRRHPGDRPRRAHPDRRAGARRVGAG